MTVGARPNYGSQPNWAANNAIVVEGLTAATLTISTDRNLGGGDRRASIAGVQLIENAYIPGGPVTDLTIDGPVSGGTEMVLMWTGENAKLYTLETNSNLIIANWQAFETNIVGNGGTVNVTNAIGPNETFYRVISE